MSGAIAIDSKNALSFPSFGAENERTFGSGFRSRSVLFGERYRDMDMRQSYYDCTQHDGKQWDFDGRIYSPRSMAQPLLGSEKMGGFIPLKARRPSSPYRLGKIIIDAFTNLLFGEQRFPAIRVDGDTDTEDFAQTLARVGKLPLKMIQARALGGSMGTVGMSWCYHRGKPHFEVHNAKNLYVHSWEDRSNLIPRHVTETGQFFRVEWNGKEFVNQYYWYRRDWTPEWDFVFENVRVDPNVDPVWLPDMSRSVKHDDGITHFVWIQNRPSEEIDGTPDYHGLYESFDTLDLLMSVVARGAALNLDPTLKLKMDPDLVNRMGLRKGSDNAIITGEGGDAEYMELEGSSIEAGLKLIDMKRRSILETAQCIIPDPSEVAAQGVSSVAIKAMFAPMLGAVDILREQYGTAIELIMDGLITVARKMGNSKIMVTDPDTKEVKEGELVIVLPPRVERSPDIDPDTGKQKTDSDTGEPTPEKVTLIARKPGAGGELNLRWPPSFAPTPTDQQAIVTTMQLATGGKAFLSAKTATDITAAAFGIDSNEEQRRLDTQSSSDKAAEAAMTPPGAGGEVDDPNELPLGANPRNPFAKPGSKDSSKVPRGTLGASGSADEGPSPEEK